jgi:hypothetical protein
MPIILIGIKAPGTRSGSNADAIIDAATTETIGFCRVYRIPVCFKHIGGGDVRTALQKPP